MKVYEKVVTYILLAKNAVVDNPTVVWRYFSEEP